jgi:hypothetical protein
VHTHAGGIPRLVNMLCDFALVYGYAEGRRLIDFEVVQEVAETRRNGGLSGLVDPPVRPDRGEMRARCLRALADLARGDGDDEVPRALAGDSA